MRQGLVFSTLWLLGFAVSGCAQEEYPLGLYEAQHGLTQGGTEAGVGTDAGGPANLGPQTCAQARATSIPARLVAISSMASTGAQAVLVSDVFQAFLGVCGQCHGPTAATGGFQISTAIDFQSAFTSKELAHVLSNGPTNPSKPEDPNDLKDPMPPFNSPNGEPFSMRTPEDPVWQFATLAQQWIAAGSPNSFVPSTGMADAGAEGGADAGGLSPFLMRPIIGDSMTNIGDCIPSPALVATEQTKSAQLDTMFSGLQAQDTGTAAQQIGLPEHLGDTDLFTLDTRTLAQYGVIAYAPGYPLWADNAGKLRYVRVPRGTSIHFNKQTQQFEIPANTRFYKTFTKQIVDTDGSIRFRKIETRLIVSRPDTPGLEGDSAPTALYGTYKWNDAETDAILVETPLRDGLPWADTVFEYHTDEQLAADILSGNPADPEEALLESNPPAARHYAIPSRDRCQECHQGSPSQSFVLGFTPLQINRRPKGQGGTIEDTGPDELTQLQRLIDYGLITGIDSLSDVLPIEQSQPPRTPRNDYEVIAQGYVLGNCVHCHNPRGDPSVENPVLKTALDFLPAPGPIGGLFQFPLEHFSPRILRGIYGTTRIPYITPSLIDQPRYDPQTPEKIVPGPFEKQGKASSQEADVIFAPWRSLIYRNTDTAFSYTDDYGLYPHMPRNTPGYDPRAKQILGTWMVSVPSVRKHPELAEVTFCTQGSCDPTDPAGFFDGVPDQSEQPYVEVMPGDPRYDDAVKAAEARLTTFYTGASPGITLPAGVPLYSRYADPGDTTDTVDPQTVRDPVCHPVPSQSGGLPPEHPQWSLTDLTDPPGPYTPRRSDWTNILIGGQADQGDTAFQCSGGGGAADQGALADEQSAVGDLQGVAIDAAFKTLATTKVPFGLWVQQPGCNFAGQPTVGSLTGASAPRWLSLANASPTDPVYSESPGAAVFKTICINCHGAQADSNGRLSKNLADMTGGQARVADFRDGFMGPVGSSADKNNRNMDLAFGVAALPANPPAAWTSVTDDDRAARYMAWMALGGTKVVIPQAILQIVSLTQVLGQPRPYLPASSISANMLSTAKSICQTFLGTPNLKGINPVDPSKGIFQDVDKNRALIHSNGDAETWFNLCTYNPNNPAMPAGNHRAPVRVFHFGQPGCASSLCEQPVYADNLDFDVSPDALLDPSSYPADQPVGTSTGTVLPAFSQLDAKDPWPWCVVSDSPIPGAAATISANGWPTCPTTAKQWTTADASAWAVRGAINVGLSVFLYVQTLEAQDAPDPDYNECQSLPAAH